MCVIVVKPKGVQIRKGYLKNCYLSNPDGAGFMYVKDGKVVILKGYFHFETFYADFAKAEKINRKSPFVLHFRIATSGGVNYENCHPFKIDEHNAFVHNGIFYNLSYANYNLSDTQVFNNTILQNLPTGWQNSTGVFNLLETYAKESASKLAFLSDSGKVLICAEEDGTWYKGSWYSNEAYLPTKAFSFPETWYPLEKSEYRENEMKYPEGTIRCEECALEVDYSETIFIHEFGYICAECAEEYKETLVQTK